MTNSEYKNKLYILEKEYNDIAKKIKDLNNTYHNEVLERNGYKKGTKINYNGFNYIITGIHNIAGKLYLKGYNVKDNNKENIIIQIKILT